MARRLGLPVAVLAMALIVLSVCVVQAQNPVELTIFRDEDSLTIFVPGNQHVSLQGFRLEVKLSSDQRVSVLVAEYPAFSVLYFNNIPTPVCFRLERDRSTSTLPLECQGVTTLIQRLPDVNVFWYDLPAHMDRSILVSRDVEPIGVCPAGQNRCELIYSPPPFTPTATWAASLTPTLTVTPIFTPNDVLTLAATNTPPGTPSPTPILRNTDWTPVVEEFDGVEMVLVPAGCFEMGSTEEEQEAAFQQCEQEKGVGNCERDWYAVEGPAHRVCFEEQFWIDRTEVSQAQFAAFGGQAVNNNLVTGDERPRETITWYEARDFCRLRGARLPTEAEWEYAARGPDALAYPWGNEFDCSRGNFDDETVMDEYVVEGGAGCDGFDETAPVGSFPAGDSWVGALDMSGNIWEWVADWYGPYPMEPQIDPHGPDDGDYRMLRGGAFFNLGYVGFLRAASRYGFTPDFVSPNIGFRCARLD